MSIEILANDCEIKALCSLIENNGYRAYLVGGCVRDALMGTRSSDIDITTSAMPEEICRTTVITLSGPVFCTEPYL